ncbi:PEP-CTERM sorting domain-containing protein [Azohydromonas australica]|uniref:PEP-CTERM sorting domain-containing protein n=1 Tax=Azohydromonas australica TaxID=364039 RepID=UPI000402B032|nr:PEP-CTERM sorting domain-containing protein [Azohydromonas australica]
MKLILPVLIAVAAPTAMAALSARIEVGNMQFEVTDLTPDDNIAARHEVFGIVGSYASVQVKQDGGSDTAHVLDQRSVSFSLDKPWGWGYSEVTAPPDRFRVVAEGTAGKSGSVLGGVNVHTFGQIAYVLGPYTAVTVTSDYLLEMHADKVLGASRDEVVSGYLYSFLDTFEAAAYANPEFGSNDVRLSGQLLATFMNDSNRVVVVDHIFASEFDARPAALIPEPTTGGMFAAGLGLLGLWTQRRKR